MLVDPRKYFIEQKSKFPQHEADWEALDLLYENKLWYELTGKIEKFLKADIFKTKGELIKIYQKCIIEFENRINCLTLIRIINTISHEYDNDLEEKYKFFSRFDEKTAINKEASALLLLFKAEIWLQKSDTFKAKELIDSASEILDKHVDGISSVHTDLHKLTSEYFEVRKEPVLYYQETLKYLGLVDLTTLSETEKEGYAYKLAIASLLGDDIYNFIELLSHPILESLKGKPQYKWLIDLLYAFNSGQLEQMENLKPQWSKIPELNAKTTLLQQKIKLLALMEMAYRKPANNRQLSFAEISKGILIQPDEVEWLVMKGLSLGLIKGKIDQITQKVFIKWVQPRVLDVQQMETMRSMLEKWCASIRAIQNTFQRNAQELIHF